MAAKKSTIVRNGTLAATQAALAALDRHAPALGGRLAERLWWSVGAPPSRAKRARAGTAGGAPFSVPVGGSYVRGRTFGAPGAPVAALVHGWGGWWQQLGAFVPLLLEQGYRVVAFDAPGHGDSGRGAMGRRASSLPEMAAAYAAVAERHGAPEVTVAHSMGCLAVLWAQREDGIAPAQQVLLAPASTGAGMLEVFASTLALSPAARADLAGRFARRIGRPLGDFDLLPLVEAEQEAGRLGEALIVHDRGDAVTSAVHAQQLAERWRGARLALTDGLGHSRLLRAPEVLTEAARFLAARSAPGQPSHGARSAPVGAAHR